MALYSPNASEFVIGSLCNNTNLLKCGRYFFREKGMDFTGDKDAKFHNVIFRAIENLAKSGCVSIDGKDIYEHLKSYPSALAIFENSNGLKFINNIKQLSNEDSFDYYYGIVKKYSLLRCAKNEKHINITEIIDETKQDEQQIKRFQEMTIKDVINFLEDKIYDLKSEFPQEDDNTNRKQAGKNSLETFKKFKNKEFYGVTFESEFVTEILGGFRKQQVYMTSSDTSGGKSRTIAGSLAKIGMKKLYNYDTQQWEDNPCYCNSPTLYIGTEMELGEEVEPLFVAYILNIESSVITKGETSYEQDILIEETLKIIEDSKLFLVDMPQFNISRLEQEIKHYKTKYGIDFVGFDYIALNSQTVNEFVTERGSGIGSRGDEILLALMEALKQIAKKYDVGVLTASQVNSLIKDYMKRDYEVLRGAKSMADKLTGGIIGMPITQQELKLVEPYILDYNSHGFNNHLEPNYVDTIYKARFSNYPKELKVFSHYNLGTMRKTEMFVTTKDFMPIDIKKLKLITNKKLIK